jgi:hypothetical protein
MHVKYMEATLEFYYFLFKPQNLGGTFLEL